MLISIFNEQLIKESYVALGAINLDNKDLPAHLDILNKQITSDVIVTSDCRFRSKPIFFSFSLYFLFDILKVIKRYTLKGCPALVMNSSIYLYLLRSSTKSCPYDGW